jgi:hypothetical protein
MKSLPSPTRVLRLGLALFLTVVLAACGGGEAPAAPAAQAAPTALIAKTPVIRCAP